MEERRLQARLGALQAMYAHLELVMRTQLACQQALAEYTPPPPHPPNAANPQDPSNGDAT